MKPLLLYSCLSQSKPKRRKRKVSNYLSFKSFCFSMNTSCMKSGKGSCNACLARKPATILILMMGLLVEWQLRATILKDMLQVFPISSAVIVESLLLFCSLDLLTNQTGKMKDMIIFEDSITETVTSQVIPSRLWVAQITKTEPAGYIHA